MDTPSSIKAAHHDRLFETVSSTDTLARRRRDNGDSNAMLTAGPDQNSKKRNKLKVFIVPSGQVENALNFSFLDARRMEARSARFHRANSTWIHK